MASRFLRLFIDPEKLAEANRKYKKRMAEIKEGEETFDEALATARANNKAAFLAAIDANTTKRNSQLKNGRY